MKKVYIAPDMEVIEINAASPMLMTMSINGSQKVDTASENGQLGRDDNSCRPSTPNLWEQSW